MLVRLGFLILFLIYFAAFVGSVSPYWFNPLFTTDDALQQTFPLYEALYPGVFAGDIVTTAMVGYLPPIHFWLSFWITTLVGDPNIAGHWVMLIQLSICLSFLFLAVRSIAPLPVALFSVFWFLHTRNLVQRMTLGIPRGWGGVIICAFLYYLLTKKHRGVLAALALGTLLNPPATFLCAAAYGIYLLYAVYLSKIEHPRVFFQFLFAAPFIVGLALLSTARPPEIGHMVNLAEARANPAFDRSGGRFAFLPFKTPMKELETIGMQAFVNKWHKDPTWLIENIFYVVAILFFALLVTQRLRKRILFPPELLTYLLAIFVVYFLSREFAFKLYVPDRHLQYPLNLFSIVAFPVAIWRMFYRGDDSQCSETTIRSAGISSCALLLFGSSLFYSGGSGLEGTANFNTRTDSQSGLHSWIRLNTPIHSVIAGHPSNLNGVPLFSIRRAYMTTEVAHPFYDRYYAEVKRRLEVVFRAYYSSSWESFVEALGDEKIDYFVFRNQDFTPERLKSAGYDKPLKNWVRRLATKYPPAEYVFNKLPMTLDPISYPFMVYRDAEVTIIDLKILKEHITQQRTSK